MPRSPSSFRPISLPQVNCATSLNWVAITRNNSNPAPPAEKDSAGSSPSSMAVWLRPKTVIIRPQLRVPMALRYPLVSPISAMTSGRSRNIQTGIQTMNIP